jgi:hypothetical protein
MARLLDSRLPGLKPHKRKVNCEALRWVNGFVPEGQADSSQARSAWGLEFGPF